MPDESVQIIGLGGDPVTVDSDYNVTQSAAAPAQDVMADMKAAVAGDEPAADKVAEPEKPAEEAKTEDDKAVEGAPAGEPAGDKPADDKAVEAEPKDKPAEEKPAGDDKSEEEKAAEEKTEEEKATEAKEAEVKEPVEPSETEKLVEEIGGVEVLKAARPFVESVYDPELPVSERVSRLESFVPEPQMKEIRNEVFWQAAETPEIQEMLKSDPEIQDLIAGDPVAREAFAQKVFGVPFGYLEKVFNDDKTFLSPEDFAAAVEEFKTAHPPAKAEPAKAEEKTEPVKAPAKPAAKTEAKAEEPSTLTPAFTNILDTLSQDVDEIVATAQFDPSDKDDADTARLKAEGLKAFESEWPKAFMGDEEAMKAYRAVKSLADQGSEEQARHKYPALAKQARRIAAQLLERVATPLTEHRTKVQAKGKAAAAARTETKTASKEKTFEAPAKTGVDVSALKTDEDVMRAMNESIARNSK